MSSEKKKNKMSTRTLALMGMMIAITAVLSATPLGLIPLPLASASTVHIPTLIIAILEGPLVGGIVGGAMGFITLIRALLAPAGILDPYFVNPIISVIPRIMVGVVAGYCYRAMRKGVKSEPIRCLVSGAVGSAINTLVVMGLLYAIYLDSIAQAFAAANMEGTVRAAFIGVITTSGLMEMIASAVICALVGTALRKVIYKNK